MASLTTASITAGTKEVALGGSFTEDFSTNSSHFSTYHTGDEITYGTDNGLELTLAKRFDNPSIKSDFTIMFGHMEIVAQVAPGTGVATTVYLQSDDLDEIDIEWLGGDDTQVQSNFFSKGDTTTYDRGAFHSVSSPTTTFHTYAIDWTEERLQWLVDGEVVRTLENNTSSGYPQTPMYVYIGVWAAGDSSNAPGTIEWAGGSTDYSQAPFNAYFKSFSIVDYSTGDSYEYSDDSGDWTSIVAENGEVLGNLDGTASSVSESSTQTSASSTKTSSASSTSSTFSSSSATSTSSSSSASASSSLSSSSSSSSTSTIASSTTSTSSSSSTPSTVSSSSTNSITTLSPVSISSSSSESDSGSITSDVESELTTELTASSTDSEESSVDDQTTLSQELSSSSSSSSVTIDIQSTSGVSRVIGSKDLTIVKQLSSLVFITFGAIVLL